MSNEFSDVNMFVDDASVYFNKSRLSIPPEKAKDLYKRFEGLYDKYR